jgi:hypothetical protein
MRSHRLKSHQMFHPTHKHLLKITTFTHYKRKSKSSRKYLTWTVWCTMSLYHPDSVLLVNSMCKFCTGCTMQFRGSGVTSGRQGQWFLHHNNAQSHTLLVVQQHLSSPNHRTLQILLSDFWLFPSLKMCLNGDTFCNQETSNCMWQLNSGRFQKKPSTGTSNNSRIDGASVSPLSYHYSTIPPFQEHLTAHYIFKKLEWKIMPALTQYICAAV